MWYNDKNNGILLDYTQSGNSQIFGWYIGKWYIPIIGISKLYLFLDDVGKKKILLHQESVFSQQPPLEFSTVKNGQRYPKLKGMLTTYSPSLLELKKESDFSKRTVTTCWLTVFWCFSTNCLRCRFTNPTLSWLLGLWEVGWSMFHVPVMVCLWNAMANHGETLYM